MIFITAPRIAARKAELEAPVSPEALLSEKVLAQVLSPEAAVAEKLLSEAVPEVVLPEVAVSEVAVSEVAVSEVAVSEEVVSEVAVSEEVVPKVVLPDLTFPTQPLDERVGEAQPTPEIPRDQATETELLDDLKDLAARVARLERLLEPDVGVTSTEHASGNDTDPAVPVVEPARDLRWPLHEDEGRAHG